MMALYGTMDARSNKISHTWTFDNPELLDPLVYSDVFESEPDICWQAVFELCPDGTKKCGLKFRGCSVLGPVFPMEVEFTCFEQGAHGRRVVGPIIKTFDSYVDECREIASKDSSSLNLQRLCLCYRITTRKYTNFTIPRSRLLQDVPQTNKPLTVVDFRFPQTVYFPKAHMGVLASRSSVFAAMFKADMKEKQQKSVTITDIRGAVFAQLLQFIHTDKAQPNNKMLIELLSAAEKYDLARLKAACERALFRGVSLSTAIETLMLADKHNAQQLKMHTLDFIAANADHVLRNGWETLVKGQPQLLLEVYRAMAKK